MITITDEASFEAALGSPIDETLRTLLTVRLELYRAEGLLDLTMLAVVESGDTEADIERETGLNPLVSPIDRARYPSENFEQYWDWLELRAGWFEWICCAGDTGYATILLIPDSPGVDPQVLSLLRAYAGGGE